MSETHYTKGQATDKLANLTADEWTKAFIYAKFILKHSREPMSYEDLVDEAVARTLEGRRKWKIGMDGPSHLFGAMKSILSSWNKTARLKQRVFVNVTALVSETDYDLGMSHSDLVSRLSTAAEALLSDGNLSETEDHVLSGLLAGDDPESILQGTGLGADEYHQAVLSLVGKMGSGDQDDGG